MRNLKKNQTHRNKDILGVVRGRSLGLGEMSEGNQKVPTSSYMIRSRYILHSMATRVNDIVLYIHKLLRQ